MREVDRYPRKQVRTWCVCHVYLSTCVLATCLLRAAVATTEGAARILGQDHFDIGMRSRDHMDRCQFADALGSRGACICGSLHRTHITAHHHSHIATTDIFTADESDIRGF